MSVLVHFVCTYLRWCRCGVFFPTCVCIFIYKRSEGCMKQKISTKSYQQNVYGRTRHRCFSNLNGILILLRMGLPHRSHGLTASTFLSGTCLLPGTPANLIIFSSELYIQNTSTRASFVLIVRVGSTLPPTIKLFLRPCPKLYADLCLSSLKSTGTDEDEAER